MKTYIKNIIVILFIGLASCKPDIDRSAEPLIVNVLISNSKANTLSISYSLKSFVLPEKVAISPISPAVTGTIISCSVSPTLPTGLTIDNMCKISGTPTITQVNTLYAITAVNGNLTASDSIQISVTASSTTLPPTPPANSFTYPGAPYAFTLGSGIVPISPNITGSFSSFSISPALPTGLFMAAASGQLTGNPSTVSANTLYTVTGVITSGGTFTFSFNLQVVETAPSALSYTGSPFSFPEYVLIPTLNPSITGTPNNCVSAPTLPAGLTISTACAISGTPTTVQGNTSYTITASNTGGSTNTSITIAVTAYPNKRMFLTGAGYISGTHFSTPTAADALCNADAGKPLGSGTYKALVVSSQAGNIRIACTTSFCGGGVGEHVDWVIAANTVYYQSNGTTIIETSHPSKGIMPPAFTNDATGAAKYWTGLNTDFTSNANNCGNWGNPGVNSTAGGTGSGANNGSANFVNSWGLVACAGAQQLLCVQQ